MHMTRFVISMVAALMAAGSALAAPGGTFTLSPGENTTIYEFGNMTGSVVIETDQPINVRWISTGEKKEIQNVAGTLELRLPQKLDGRLEASNPNGTPTTVRVTERTQVSNLAQTWERFWGTLAGSRSSEVNKAHREVKRWVKRCAGLCKG
jgi:hypothetical protein